MSIRFAARANALAPRLSATAARRAVRQPANDNSAGYDDQALLQAALRHFGDHGLAAARKARIRAETAFFAGDRQAYQWWLGVCRILDRRLARELEAARQIGQ